MSEQNNNPFAYGAAFVMQDTHDKVLSQLADANKRIEQLTANNAESSDTAAHLLNQLNDANKRAEEAEKAVEVLAKQLATVVNSWGPKCVIKDEVHQAVVEMIVRVGQDPIARAAVEKARGE